MLNFKYLFGLALSLAYLLYWSFLHFVTVHVTSFSLFEIVMKGYNKSFMFIVVLLLGSFVTFSPIMTWVNLILIPHLPTVNSLAGGTTLINGSHYNVYYLFEESGKIEKIDFLNLNKIFISHEGIFKNVDFNHIYGDISTAIEINEQLLIHTTFLLLLGLGLFLVTLHGVNINCFFPRLIFNWDIKHFLLLLICFWGISLLQYKLFMKNRVDNTKAKFGTLYQSELEQLKKNNKIQAKIIGVSKVKKRTQTFYKSDSKLKTYTIYLTLEISQGLTFPIYLTFPLESIDSFRQFDVREAKKKFEKKFPADSIVTGKFEGFNFVLHNDF